MMHRPSAPELLKPGQSYYSLVVAVAKRAREISQIADESHEILIEKPVISLQRQHFQRLTLPFVS